MSGRPWPGLALSVALHAAVLALVLVAISRDEMLPALMVDLREPFVPGAASVASPARGERPARPSPPARSPRSKTRDGNHAVAPATPPSSPPEPSAPAAPPIVATPVVEAPPPTPAPAATIEPAPQGAPQDSGEPVPRADGASAVAGTGRAGTPTGDRGIIGGVAIAAHRPGGPEGEGGGSPGPRVAAVAPGAPGSGAGAEYGPYLAALRERIQRSVRYPVSARRRGLGGTVNVEILILANGSVGDVTLLESSTHALLDAAALDTIRSLPRMPLPPELPARPLRVRVPVVFQMR